MHQRSPGGSSRNATCVMSRGCMVIKVVDRYGGTVAHIIGTCQQGMSFPDRLRVVEEFRIQKTGKLQLRASSFKLRQ